MSLDLRFERTQSFLFAAFVASVMLMSGGSTRLCAADKPSDRVGHELFEKRIRPALIRYCYECHASDSDDIGGELLLDSPTALLRGGETGPSLVPGKPRDSLLQRAIEYRDLEMPPDAKMPDNVIAAFRRWIALGAPDPREQVADVPLGKDDGQDAAPVDLWSFDPVVKVAPPDVKDSAWCRTEVDRFIKAKLEENGLNANEDADPATRLRRLYFDLVGLPPSPHEVAAFVEDPSDERYQLIVDQLLNSPSFGERWGRHWLDVARYAESAGSSRDVLMPYAWRYRDYVIDSFNDDVPFDRFVTEQVAGDLLPAENESVRQRQMIATGLLAIGSKSLNGGNLTYDIIDDQIDVVSKAILGITVSCARCHDHKFDPIPTRDYYSLAGFFLNTDTRYGGGIKRPKTASDKAKQYLILDKPLEGAEAESRDEAAKKVERLEKQVASSKKRVSALATSVPADFRDDIEMEIPQSSKPAEAKLIRQYQGASRLLKQRQSDLKAAFALLGPEPDYALGVQDKRKVTEAKVLVRGEKDQPGEVAPRGFLTSLGNFCEPMQMGEDGSGRQQLAGWLVHPENPLTSRVAVNRIWQHLMESGLVETVDNFGASGLRPSHPELLDYLAARFVDTDEWSIKELIRHLVNSRVYRLSSEWNEAAFQADPDNRLRWRMPRRRLEAEPLRDAMLAVSGLLDLNRPEGSLVLQLGEGEVGRNLDTSVLDEPFNHRSVYLPIIRGIIPEQLRLFDFPEPSNVQGVRDSNTTPTQSLFLMNSDFAVRLAEKFAQRLLEDVSLQNDVERVRYAHLLCFATEPSDAAVERDTRYIRQMRTQNVDEAANSDEAAKSPGRHRASEKTLGVEELAWTTYCQSLLASARFRLLD